MLKPVINDLVILEQSGLFLTKLGRTVKGTDQCVVADNLGAHSIAGLLKISQGHTYVDFAQQQDQSSRLKKSEVKSLL